jgi:3-oxoacyl-[acyl-carrier protein] reductase
MSFDGKTIIITGAGQGIGRQYAHAFAAAGGSVAIVDLNGTAAQNVAAGIGDKAVAIETDVSDKASVDAMAQQVLDRFGRIDVLVNNAAIFSTLKMKAFTEITPEEFDTVMGVNARGVFLCCQAVAGPMRAQGSGKIINISSSVVVTGRANYAHYIASKGAVIGMTRALATELGPDNINVNAISPHGIVTEVPRETIREDQWADIIAAQALKRKGSSDDMIGSVMFLASPQSDYMTGQTLNLDAGLRYN